MGIRGAVITLTDSEGNQRFAYTNSFGYFTIDEVAAGRSYVIAISGSKRQFDPSSFTITTLDEITDIVFTAVD
jgi:hypothetical protein